MTAGLNVWNSTKRGTMPTAIAVATPAPVCSKVALEIQDLEWSRTGVQHETNAQKPTRMVAQMLLVNTFTLQAKNSWTAIPMTPCALDKSPF